MFYEKPRVDVITGQEVQNIRTATIAARREATQSGAGFFEIGSHGPRNYDADGKLQTLSFWDTWELYDVDGNYHVTTQVRDYPGGGSSIYSPGTPAWEFLPNEPRIPTWYGGAVLNQIPFKCNPHYHHMWEPVQDTEGSIAGSPSVGWGIGWPKDVIGHDHKQYVPYFGCCKVRMEWEGHWRRVTFFWRTFNIGIYFLDQLRDKYLGSGLMEYDGNDNRVGLIDKYGDEWINKVTYGGKHDPDRAMKETGVSTGTSERVSWYTAEWMGNTTKEAKAFKASGGKGYWGDEHKMFLPDYRLYGWDNMPIHTGTWFVQQSSNDKYMGMHISFNVYYSPKDQALHWGLGVFLGNQPFNYLNTLDPLGFDSSTVNEFYNVSWEYFSQCPIYHNYCFTVPQYIRIEVQLAIEYDNIMDIAPTGTVNTKSMFFTITIDDFLKKLIGGKTVQEFIDHYGVRDLLNGLFRVKKVDWYTEEEPHVPIECYLMYCAFTRNKTHYPLPYGLEETFSVEQVEDFYLTPKHCRTVYSFTDLIMRFYIDFTDWLIDHPFNQTHDNLYVDSIQHVTRSKFSVGIGLEIASTFCAGVLIRAEELRNYIKDDDGNKIEHIPIVVEQLDIVNLDMGSTNNDPRVTLPDDQT